VRMTLCRVERSGSCKCRTSSCCCAIKPTAHRCGARHRTPSLLVRMTSPAFPLLRTMEEYQDRHKASKVKTREEQQQQ
jgi:hypothetical protein